MTVLVLPWAVLAVIGVVVFGLLGLKLIAVLINGLVAQRRPHHMAERGSSSAGVAVLLVGGSLLAVLLGAGLLYRARGVAMQPMRSIPHQVHMDTHDTARVLEQLSDVRTEMLEAVHDATQSLPAIVLPPGDVAAIPTGADVVVVQSQAKESAASETTTTIAEVPESGTTSASVDNATDNDAITLSSDNGSAAAPQEPEAPATAAATDSPVAEDVAQSTSTDSSHAAESSPSEATVPDSTRQEQLSQIASVLGQLLNQRLEQNRQNAMPNADGSMPADSDVLVFQPSAEIVDQVLGESGREMLKSLNDQLPDSIRQTYALIPLSPPVAAAVTPGTPLIPDGSLDTIASSLFSLVRIADPASISGTVGNSPVVLATEPELKPEPDWVAAPGGRRIVARTKPIMPDDDPQIPLTTAVNEALREHMATITTGLHPALLNESKSARMTMSPETAAKCVVDKWDRFETVESEVEGSKPFRVIYALVEFPEAVDTAVVSTLRRSAQETRITGLATVIGLAWLGVMASGCGIRLWRRGGGLRKTAAVPVVAVLALPSLIAAGVLAVAMSRGEVPLSVPWQDATSNVQIDVG